LECDEYLLPMASVICVVTAQMVAQSITHLTLKIQSEETEINEQSD